MKILKIKYGGSEIQIAKPPEKNRGRLYRVLVLSGISNNYNTTTSRMGGTGCTGLQKNYFLVSNL